MSWRIEHADALPLLRELPTDWAQTCITSPPYWGLRDYGLRPSTWGGETRCRHSWGPAQRGKHQDLLPAAQTSSRGGLDLDGRQGQAGLLGGRFFERCQAWQGCLGLEPTPEMYVEHLVTVLEEVRRVLRPDGTLWLVLGDSYAAARSYQVPDRRRGVPVPKGASCVPAGCKAKDLVGIPWRVALALRAQGWWLRSDIVWAKPNPMPENVRDRPTRAHEYLFLLAKQPRYFYDAHAIREPDTGRRSGNGYARPGRLTYQDRRGQRGQHQEWKGGQARQRRSWWTVTARGYPGAQAVFPEKLIEPCVLAGSPPVACGICGAPWKRGATWDAPNGTRLPSCQHNDGSGRSLVLDPFCGSGTTGAVATRLGRDFLGIELGAATARLARRRLSSLTKEQEQ
ncbi:MAG TPA: site-specific DNA-methyltransferase [Solirubrobacteraceae bacterium]|nr:site-specific DNA-methyltransferase [Solirubrobacteraceae bacterium]